MTILTRTVVGKKGLPITQRVSDQACYVYDTPCPNCDHELVTTHRYTGCEDCGYVEYPRER